MCQYFTVFQYPAQEKEFKGLSEVQRNSVVPKAHNLSPASCREPEIQTFSRENSWDQVLYVSTKQPLLPPSRLRDGSKDEQTTADPTACEWNFPEAKLLFILLNNK